MNDPERQHSGRQTCIRTYIRLLLHYSRTATLRPILCVKHNTTRQSLQTRLHHERVAHGGEENLDRRISVHEQRHEPLQSLQGAGVQVVDAATVQNHVLRAIVMERGRLAGSGVGDGGDDSDSGRGRRNSEGQRTYLMQFTCMIRSNTSVYHVYLE